jgi:hypothetical protein
LDTVEPVQAPSCAKLLGLVQRTAAFVAHAGGDGGDVEDRLRAQHKPALAFLEPSHADHRHYRWELDLALAASW